MAINKKLEQRDIIRKQIHMSACVIFLKRGSVQTNIFTASRNIWNVLILWGGGISRHHLVNHLHVTRRWLHSETSEAAVRGKTKREPLETTSWLLTRWSSINLFFGHQCLSNPLLQNSMWKTNGQILQAVWFDSRKAGRLRHLQLAVVVSLHRRKTARFNFHF